MDNNLFDIRILSANLYRSAAGSVPVDRTNIKGITGEDSLYNIPKSLDCGSTNRLPKLDDKKSCMALVILSERRLLRTIIFWKSVNSVLKGSGSASLKKHGKAVDLDKDYVILWTQLYRMVTIRKWHPLCSVRCEK